MRRRRLRLALLGVDDLLVERRGDALGDAAAHLALHDRRVDHHAAVLHDDVALDRHAARLGVDLHHGAVRGVGERARAGRSAAARRGPGSTSSGSRWTSRWASARDVLERDGSVRGAADDDLARRAARGPPGAASSRCAPIALEPLGEHARRRAWSAPPPTTVERLANVPQPYGVASVSPWMTSMRAGLEPELVGRDLGERRAVLLAVPGRADRDRHAGRWVHPHPGRLVAGRHGHLALAERLAAVAGALGEAGEAEADQAARPRARGLALAQLVVAERRGARLERLAVGAAVDHEPGRASRTGSRRRG